MSGVRGRHDDMLIVRGANLYPSEVEAILLTVEDLQPHYVLVVDRTSTLARLEVRVEPAPALLARCGGFQAGHPELARLRHQVAQQLHKGTGLTIDLTLVAPHTIPRSEGKAIRVIEKS